MEVVFERTGHRRYAVEIRRSGEPALRLDPAPGFDRWFPHDLQHFVVEEQLGIEAGIFGRLAAGGTASTFRPVLTAGSRAQSRRRRRLERREATLRSGATVSDVARSERATSIAHHDWLAHHPDREKRRHGHDLAANAHHVLERMDVGERAALEAALPRLRERINQVASQWESLDIGQSMTLRWPLGRR